MKPAPSPAASTRSPSRVPRLARLTGPTALPALVAALVIGILGMHALASHGAPAAHGAATSTMAASGTTGMSGMSGMTGTAHVTGDQHVAKAAGGALSGSEPGVEADPGAGHDMASMVMLCVVMLATAAFTWLALLVAGGSRPLLPTAFGPAVVRSRTVRRVRGTGPPYVWQFSVIRC